MAAPAVVVNPVHQAKSAPVAQLHAASSSPSGASGWALLVFTETKAFLWWLIGAPMTNMWRVYVQQEPLDRVGFPVSGLFLLVAISVLYLSLDHLTWAIHEISARKGPNTGFNDSRLLAIAIDCGLVLSEIKLVVDLKKHGKGSKWSWITVVGTSVMSAAMNAWAFAFDVLSASPDLNPFIHLGGGGAQIGPFFKFWASVGFGVFVPAATFVFLKQATELWYEERMERDAGATSQGAAQAAKGKPSGGKGPRKPRN